MSKNTLVYDIYGKSNISERHRHRYEFNNNFSKIIFSESFKPSGINPDTGLIEIIELKDHPWFIGVQFHPEYKSTVSEPHPLFVSFVNAALTYSKSK